MAMQQTANLYWETYAGSTPVTISKPEAVDRNQVF